MTKKVHILQEKPQEGRNVCGVILYWAGTTIKQLAAEDEFDEKSNIVAIFPDHGSRYE